MALDMELTLVEPKSPSGMVLITKSGRQRWIWPVHLPGWLAEGWQVAGPTSTPAPEVASAIDLPAQATRPAPEPAQARRRGRKAKAAEPADTPELTDSSLLVETGAASSDANAVEPEQFDATTSDATPSDAAAATAAEAGSEGTAAASGFALPNDLLSAEF
jgi:hypothetical protein